MNTVHTVATTEYSYIGRVLTQTLSNVTVMWCLVKFYFTFDTTQ